MLVGTSLGFAPAAHAAPGTLETLTATAGANSVTLDWTYTVGTTDVSTWQFRQKKGTGSYSSWAIINSLNLNSRSHTFTGLEAGATYTYKLRAYAGGTSNELTSNEVTPYPGTDITQVEVTSTPTSGTTPKKYGAGEKIQITVTFDEAMTVTGDPQFEIKLGNAGQAVAKRAAYISGSGSMALVFEYTVQSGDMDDNGIWIEADAVKLNGGTIRDGDSNDADLRHTAPRGQSSHKVDGSLTPTAPTVSSAEVTAAAPKELVITFDKALATDSTPAASAFTVKVGGTAEPQPTAVSISGSAVTLTLAVALDASQSNVTVDYTNPGTANSPLKDASDNEVATFANQSVTNNAPACPTGQPGDALWTACLTVGEQSGSRLWYGFSAGSYGALSARTFSAEGTSYELDALEVKIGATLSISFTADPGSAANTWILQVGDRTFNLGRNRFRNSGFSYQWGTTGINWDTSNIGDKVSVSLKQGNRRPTGKPTISDNIDPVGTVQAGEVLAADTTGITDPDGLTSASYSYRWFRQEDATGTGAAVISGETGATYRPLSAADIGKYIAVEVTYTDDRGTTETLTSAGVGPVGKAVLTITSPTVSESDVVIEYDITLSPGPAVDSSRIQVLALSEDMTPSPGQGYVNIKPVNNDIISLNGNTDGAPLTYSHPVDIRPDNRDEVDEVQKLSFTLEPAFAPLIEVTGTRGRHGDR